jgi:uncharacterized protein YkwD
MMTHFGADGVTNVGDRLSGTGYIWIGIGENIASGPGINSAQSAFDLWMASQEGHRDRILGDFVHMGAGVATGGNGVMYFTAVFATPWLG